MILPAERSEALSDTDRFTMLIEDHTPNEGITGGHDQVYLGFYQLNDELMRPLSDRIDLRTHEPAGQTYVDEFSVSLRRGELTRYRLVYKRSEGIYSVGNGAGGILARVPFDEGEQHAREFVDYFENAERRGQITPRLKALRP